ITVTVICHGHTGQLAFIFVAAGVGNSEVAPGAETAPRRALAIYAHPDDPDVSCGGTLARWAAAGSEVHVCLCCDGDKGSLDPAVDSKTLVLDRRHETEAAGRALGVEAHHWLGFRDGEVDDSAELRSQLVALVRGIRPDAVLAPDPTAVFFGSNYINHRDHRVVGWAVLDAVSPAAANPHYFPGSIEAYQVPVLYLSGTLEPDTWVDITATIETKATALACHTSQIGVGGEWLGNAVRERAEETGRIAGVPYAEAFRKVVLA
ncbi:MAG TPA: PIG-L deacetylase family protein, partial [Acidimicrobiales bacterium]|nr:PIG-L deacetylase family protein [Acidimicrobiales bacterium]